MKKIILLAGAMLLLLAGQSAQATVVVVTTCGKAVTTVGLDFFSGDKKEYRDYLRYLNKLECGYEADAQVMQPVEVTSIHSMTEYRPLAMLPLDLQSNKPSPSQSEMTSTSEVPVR